MPWDCWPVAGCRGSGTQANVQGWLIEAIPSAAGQDVQYVYGVALLLPGLVAAALLLDWLRRNGSAGGG